MKVIVFLHIYWKECLRRVLVRNFWIMFINVTAIIRHLLYSHWICGWVLVIFRFLSHSLNLKLRARWVRVMKEKRKERWQWLIVTSLSHQQWMPPYWEALLDFWLVSFIDTFWYLNRGQLGVSFYECLMVL